VGLPLEPTRDDILLVTDFGRSAQGWLSYMLCYLLNARYIEPYNLLVGKKFTGSPVIEANTCGNLPGRARTPYALVVKTHGYPARDRFDLTRSVVYLTRDPRDVSVSYYYLALSWRRAGSRSLGSLIHATPVICHLYVAWQWRRHFDRWRDRDVFRVRYEDLRRDTEGTLNGLLQHLGVSADAALMREAIALFSFENTYGRKRGQEDRSNPEARKGQIGDYRNHFSPWLNRLFWKICGKQAELAGYRLDGSTTTEPSSGG
jgi:hypothetical protein